MTATTETNDDLATLAKGGRTNTIGFVVRLIARIPFLVFATRLYGAEALGRFASALVLIEIVALICSLGEKRGLAQRLSEGAGDDRSAETNLVYDGMLLALIYSAIAAGALLVFPEPMFPNGMNSSWDIWLVATIPAFAVTEILLAAQAYRFDIATTVRTRAVVEPWTISIAAGVFFYVPGLRDAGLALAFIVSIYAGLLTVLWPFLRTYGLPKDWVPSARAMLAMSSRAFPIVGADAIERGTRLLDIFILGIFALLLGGGGDLPHRQHGDAGNKKLPGGVCCVGRTDREVRVGSRDRRSPALGKGNGLVRRSVRDDVVG